MRRSQTRFAAILSVVVSFATTQSAQAVVPPDQLLPGTTKGFISIPNVERLEADFNETQLGELLADPIMKPFAEDLKQQLRDRWSRAHQPLGLTWDDMRGVPSGEVAMARLLPTEKTTVAVIIADVTDNQDKADELLQKVDANMAENEASKETVEVAGVMVTVYTHTKGPDKGEQAVYYLHPEHHQLVIADDLKIVESILSRFDGESEDNLSQVKAYQVTKERVAKLQGELQPHIHWFVEPFGFIEASRLANPDRELRKKKDLFQVLKNQGFTAIKGVGGLVTFANESHDLEHYTMVYAPAVERAADDENQDKYDLAMRMLNLKNRANHTPPAWVIRDLASHVSLNADLKNGFEYAKTLVNELADDAIFEDVIRSLKEDPAGPRVDVRKEIVANLGDHVMVLTDYQLPITIESERMLICVELTNVSPVVTAINKIMENDPNARQRRIGDHIVWEVVEEEVDVPEFEFEFEFEQFEQPEDAEEEKKNLPTSAVTVAHGYLMVATHIEQVRKVLDEVEERKTLAGSIDYQMVMEELRDLGAAEDSVRYFSRTDEEYRATYELLKEGKMPEAKTLTARLLNFILDDDNDDETVREQRIDGSKLPDYQRVRRYLGPAGIFVVSVEDGWLVTGCLLKSS